MVWEGSELSLEPAAGQAEGLSRSFSTGLTKQVCVCGQVQPPAFSARYLDHNAAVASLLPHSVSHLLS